MELNEIHTEHEHASLNIKVLLLIFAVVLVGVLGYLIYQQNHTSLDTADPAVLHSKKATTATPTKTTTADNTVACGDKAYAFSMKFGALWAGYKIKEFKPTDNAAIIYCYFNMPTTDSFYATASQTNLATYASVFAVGVYTPTQWAAVVGTPDEGTKLGSNANYVWNYSQAQADPDNFTALRADVKNVVATFAIN